MRRLQAHSVAPMSAACVVHTPSPPQRRLSHYSGRPKLGVADEMQLPFPALLHNSHSRREQEIRHTPLTVSDLFA